MKIFHVLVFSIMLYGKKRKLRNVGINKKLSKSENTHCQQSPTVTRKLLEIHRFGM